MDASKATLDSLRVRTHQQLMHTLHRSSVHSERLLAQQVLGQVKTGEGALVVRAHLRAAVLLPRYGHLPRRYQQRPPTALEER